MLHAGHGTVPIAHRPLARLGIELGLGLGRQPPPPLLLVGRIVPLAKRSTLDHAGLDLPHQLLVIGPDLVEPMAQRPGAEDIDVGPGIAVGVDQGRVDSHGLPVGVVGGRGQQFVDDGGRLGFQRLALDVELFEVLSGRPLELVGGRAHVMFV